MSATLSLLFNNNQKRPDIMKTSGLIVYSNFNYQSGLIQMLRKLTGLP